MFGCAMLSKYFVVLLSIINGFSADSCNFNVKLQQEIHNEGFHRNLTYKLTFKDADLIDCYVGLDQTLPAGVYAAPDELGDLMRLNKMTAIPKSRVNIELPAEQAQPSSVFVIGKLVGREVNLWLPVHGRYHRAAKGGGFHRNEINPPRVYLRCTHNKLDCDPPLPQVTFLCKAGQKDVCVWKEVSATMASSNPVQFPVPIGDVDHIDIVAPVTLVTALIMSLYLLKTLHEYKMSTLKKGKVQKNG